MMIMLRVGLAHRPQGNATSQRRAFLEKLPATVLF
jgi:hypothetical protein